MFSIKRFIKKIIPNRFYLLIKRSKFRFIGFVRDVINIIRYGFKNSPKYRQLIYVNPQKINHIIDRSRTGFTGRDSGRVVDSDWDEHILPLTHNTKLNLILVALQNNRDWLGSGLLEYYLFNYNNGTPVDNIKSKTDFIKRYQAVEELYLHLKYKRDFKSQNQLGAFREKGGVYVHVDRNGQIIFAGSGCHRFLIAKELGFTSIPAQVGVVHKQGLSVFRTLKAE